jgi:hypothetical protein
MMRTSLVTGIVFMMLTTFFDAQAQKIIPDTTAITIGQQLNIALELEIAKGTRAEWPLLADTLSKSIEIISKSAIDSIIDAQTGSMTYRHQLVVTSFDTGFQVIPPIQFKVFETGSPNFDIRETEPLLITVSSVAVDLQAEIKDLKPIMSAPYTLRDFLPWILLGLGIALLALLGWFYYQSRKKKKPLIKLTLRQPKAAHILALELLEALKSEQLWQKGQIKEYYSRLTDILREYFDARFDVNAAEMTSDEILSAMKNHLSDAQRLKDLQKILNLSDMAKFAKARPIGAENEISHTLAVAIINSSKPAPELKPAKTESEAETATAETKTEN